jgi:hypothetical protein
MKETGAAHYARRGLAAFVGTFAILAVNGAALAKDWQEQQHPDLPDREEVLQDVVAIRPSDVWAVGYHWGYIGSFLEFRTHILHWDGFNWSKIQSSDVPGTFTNRLQGVAARSAEEVWAVGLSMGIGIQTMTTLIERWNGTQWAIVPSPNPGPSGNSLEAVTVVGDTEAWAVGSMYSTSVVSLPISMRWDGSAWTAVDVPVPSFCTERTYLTDVAARRPKNVLATGYCKTTSGDQGFILRWNGKTWKVVAGPDQIPAPSDLEGITFVSPTEAWAVGTSASLALILHWDGTAWSTVPPPADAGPESWLVSIDASRTQLWAVGLGQSSQPPFAGRLTARWDGTQWTRFPAGDFGSLNGVSVVGNQAWAVGQNIDHSLIIWRQN